MLHVSSPTGNEEYLQAYSVLKSFIAYLWTLHYPITVDSNQKDGMS
jgi:hypothetical protein